MNRAVAVEVAEVNVKIVVIEVSVHTVAVVTATTMATVDSTEEVVAAEVKTTADRK